MPLESTAVQVSVVVATRNRAIFLPDCLRSLASQTCDVAFEIVVVDNGSEDATANVVREWLGRDGRIRSVTEPEVGLSRAKNTGIRAARGGLLLFTDDDVVVEDGWIAAYVDFFNRRRSSFVVAGGPVLPIPQDLSTWPPWVRDTARLDLPCLYYGEEERPLRQFEWLWGGNMAVQREVLDVLGTFREELGRGGEDETYEDVELVDRVRGAAGEAWYCRMAPVYHRVSPDASRPRQLLLTAFNRGGNDRVRLLHGNYFQPSCHVPANRVGAALVLPWVVAVLAISAGIFRLTRRPSAFDIARRYAWGSGWCMWALVGESSRRRARLVRWAVLRARQAAFRLTPA